MPRATRVLSGWSAGEWTPYLGARIDLPQHSRSLRRCANFIVTPEGALLRRPPTRKLGVTKFPTGNVVFMEFVPDETSSYVIEAGNLYMRVWTASGPVMAGAEPLELVSPYTAEQVRELAFAQDADILYIVHPLHLPHKLRRLTSTPTPTFDLTQVTFADGRAPLGPVNTTTTTMTLTGTWPGSLTLTASANVFIAADAGRVVYLRDRVNKRGAYVRINTVSSPTVVIVTGLFRVGDTAALPAASTEWALGLFSTGRGCRALTFHEGRLWYAGFTDAPDTLVGSVSNAFDNFETVSPDPAVNDAANADKAITRRAGSGTVEAIQWLLSGSDVLLVGTAGAEFVVRPGVAGFLTPTEAAVRRTTGRGSETAVRAVRIDATAFFVQRGGRVLRQVKFDLESDGFVTEDATLLCSHLTRAGIKRMAYQQAPWSVLWLTDNRDRLFGLTIEGPQQVVGAHRHPLGGSYEGRNARVRDVACVPAPGGGGRTDLVFLQVQRTIAGQTVRTVEVLEPGVDLTEDDRLPPERLIYALERRPYVDCYENLTQTWTITDADDVGGALRFTVDGAPPLVGQTVVLRGLSWRLGQTIVSRTAATRTAYTVTETGPSWFRIGVGSVPLGPADVGLPAGVRLALDNDALPPRADLQVDTVGVPAAEAGDGYQVIADGRVEADGTLSAPASIVVGGFQYLSEFETQVLFLSGGVPADAGEPARISHVTLWLWGGTDAFVSVGQSRSAHQLVSATTEDLMGALPVPLFRHVMLPVDSDPQDVATVRCYTDGPVALDVIGMSFTMRTTPR